MALLTSSASCSPTDCNQQAPHPLELPNSYTQTHCTRYLLHLQKEIFFTTHVLVVQSLGWVQLFATLWTAVCQASLSLTISRSLSKLMFTELVMLSSLLILRYPLLSLPSVFPSIRVFSNELAVQVAKVLELQHQFFQ